MNYASVVFAGFVVIAAVWYGIWGYHNYRGPPTDAVEGHDDSSSSATPETAAELPDKLKSR
jgi:hypothetical protein